MGSVGLVRMGIGIGEILGGGSAVSFARGTHTTTIRGSVDAGTDFVKRREGVIARGWCETSLLGYPALSLDKM